MARALILALLSLPARPWGGSALELLVRGTLLLVLVFGAAWALRRSSAGLRHLVWSATLGGMLLLPLLGRSLPPLRVLPWSAAESTTPHGDEAAPPVGALPGLSASPAEDGQVFPAPNATYAARAGATQPAPSPSPASSSGSGSGSHGWSAAQLLLALWIAGLLVFLGRIVAGGLALRRIARRSEAPTSPAWTRPLYEAADIMELPESPRLLLSDDVQLPFTAGLVRPTIVLPRAAEAWTEDRRRVVLAHELAHVRRRDLVTHLLGRIACALYWFHPLVWLAARRARAEGERACDDLVLATGARASAYADHLLQIVCAAARTSAPVVAIPMAQRKEFEGRMLAILDAAPRRVGPGRLQALGALAGITLVVAGVAAAAPTVPAAGVPTAAPALSASARSAEIGQDRAAPAPPAALRLAGPSAPPQDTGKARRTRARDRNWWQPFSVPVGAPDVISDAVSGALAGLDLGDIVSQSVRGAWTGMSGGMATPMPTPTPAPAPMGWGGGRSRGLHVAEGWHRPQGKAQDPKVVAALVGALRDESPAVRARAAYSLAELEDPAAVAPLGQALRADADANVRRIAAWGLGSMDASDAGPALAVALRGDASTDVRRTAAWALGSLDCAGQGAALGEAAQRDADADVRATAVWALAECDAAVATPPLGQAMRDASPRIRRTAAWALGNLAPEKAPPALVQALKDSDADVRRTAAWALGNIADEAASPALAAALSDANPEVRRTALWAIGQTGGPAARDALIQALKSNDPEIRRWAAAALAEMR